jgi:hypothetical protein
MPGMPEKVGPDSIPHSYAPYYRTRPKLTNSDVLCSVAEFSFESALARTAGPVSQLQTSDPNPISDGVFPIVGTEVSKQRVPGMQ